MSDSENEILALFSDDHFSVIEVTLDIKNSTTHMDFKSEPPSRLLEITEHGGVLEIPKKSCAVGHSLVIDARATPPHGETVRLTVTAKVDEIEPCEDGMDRITLSLVQVREEEWFEFRRVFSSRQDEITRFLSAARGYE
jgi:hypothetical protein